MMANAQGGSAAQLSLPYVSNIFTGLRAQLLLDVANERSMYTKQNYTKREPQSLLFKITDIKGVHIYRYPVFSILSHISWCHK